MGGKLSQQARGALTRRAGKPLIHLGTGMPLDEDAVAHRPTAQMQREAWERNAAPRSITSWVMGDPPPGHSALDKRGAPCA